MQHHDDMDVELPHVEDISCESPSSSSTTSSRSLELFRQMCTLSLIKGTIYFEIYCPKHDIKQLDFYRKVRELNAKLEDWWKNLKGPSKSGSGTDNFITLLMSIGLRIAYYNSLIMIHRVIPRFHFIITHNPELRSRTSFHDLASLEAQLPLSTAACLGAARDTLRLVHHMPWRDVAWIW